MASLYKRKNSSKWWIKIYRPGSPNNPDQIPTKTADKAEAKLIMEAMVGDRAKGLAMHPKAHTLEFWRLCEEVIADYENKKRKSIAHARGRFENHIIPYLGAMVAVNITETEIRNYHTHRRKQGAKPATIRHELELIKRAFTLGQRGFRIPGPYIELPNVQNARQGFFEEADFQKVMAHIYPEYRGFLLFAYITGWRSGEIKNLRRRHLDFVGKVIRLDPGTTKNGDGRVFPMIGGLETVLAEQVVTPGFSNDYVFTYQRTTKKGAPIGERRPIGDFQKAFNTACYKAGLPCQTEPWERKWRPVSGVRVVRGSHLPHDFRRTAVRNLTRMGVSEKVAMDMCGHNTREVFDRYRIVNQGDLDSAAAKMNVAYDSLLQNLGTGTVPGTGEGKETRKLLVLKAK